MGALFGLTFCLVGVGSTEVLRAKLSMGTFEYKGIEMWMSGKLLNVINTEDFVDDYSTIVLEYYNKYTVTLDESLGLYWDSIRSGKKLFV